MRWPNADLATSMIAAVELSRSLWVHELQGSATQLQLCLAKPFSGRHQRQYFKRIAWVLWLQGLKKVYRSDKSCLLSKREGSIEWNMICELTLSCVLTDHRITVSTDIIQWGRQKVITLCQYKAIDRAVRQHYLNTLPQDFRTNKLTSLIFKKSGIKHSKTRRIT